MTLLMNSQGVSKKSHIGNKICNTGLFSIGSGWSPIGAVLASAGWMSISQEQGVALVHMD